MKNLLIVAILIGLVVTGCYNRKLGNTVISSETLNAVSSTTDSIKMAFFVAPQRPKMSKLSADSSSSEQEQSYTYCVLGGCNLEGVKVQHPTWIPPYYFDYLNAFFKTFKTPKLFQVEFKRTTLTK